MQRALFGVVYGLMLLLLSVELGRGGHGLMTPFVIAAAPLEAVAIIFPSQSWIAIAAAFATPFTWAALAVLTGARLRWVFLAAITVCYVCAAFCVANTWRDDFDSSNRNVAEILRLTAPNAIAFAVIYIAGQARVWYSFVKYSPAESRLTS